VTSSQSTADASPLPVRERIQALDVLRGVAVAGILLANVMVLRPHGTHELSDALHHLCRALIRVRALVASRRLEGAGDRGRDHCRADPAQRVVALALPLRAHRVDLAPADLRPTARIAHKLTS
jgi:predicted urease superfamily metal-dependent hydrolase